MVAVRFPEVRDAHAGALDSFTTRSYGDCVSGSSLTQFRDTNTGLPMHVARSFNIAQKADSPEGQHDGMMPRGSYVIVTTSMRGLFGGELVACDGNTVCLKNARAALHWPPSTAGFLGLTGDGSFWSEVKLGAVCDGYTVLRGVSSLSQVNEQGQARWEAQ